MKKLLFIAFILICAGSALAQSPTYRLILKNDSLVSPTSLQFDIFLERSGTDPLELASLQQIMTFNTSISVDSLTFTIVGGSSELNAGQKPTNAKLSIAGNELRIAPFPPPGAGSGTIIPATPGARVGRFQLASLSPFTHQRALIAWKNSGTPPVTKLNAYVGGVDGAITDSASHISQLVDPVLSPVTITTASPLTPALAGVAYSNTLAAAGGTLPYTWSIAGGSLPSGLSISSGGVISGTTTTAGTFPVVIQVLDNISASTSKALSLTVLPGPATHLSFVRQPSDGSAGALIAPPVTVQLRDQFENDVPTAGDTVTMALFSGTGILSGTKVRMTAANGLATFDDLRVSLAGTKRLRATRTGITSDTSNAFSLAPVAPSAVAFIQEPTDALSDATISPAITVQVRDSLGNNVHTSGIAIGISIASGTGILSGTISQLTDTGGVATFSNLSIDIVGSKTLAAGGAGLDSATSSSFTISPGPAAQVKFNQQPSNTTAGAPISPNVTVQVRDAAGNIVPGPGVQIVVSIVGSGNISGNTTRTTGGGGQAQYNNLKIDSAGVKRLRATSTGLASDTSAFFTILPGFPIRLAYVQQPLNGPAGSAISPPVVLQLKDSVGNDAPFAGDSIFIALTSGTGALTGTTRRATNSSGNASFGDLVINQGGVKALTASGPGLASLQSASFTLTAYSITATAGANGTISPAGPVTVFPGADQPFTITPNTGYHVDSVIVDGASVGPVAAYTFTNVTANHTIRTVYAINQFTITATAGPNGTITPNGSVNANFGSNQTFTITPNTGYHIDSVIVDGANAGPVGVYTFTNVTANHTIRTAYAINQFSISATAGPNGVIIPNGITIVNFGSNQSYTITPNSSYHVDSLIVDGVNQGQSTSYTFTNITANHTIRAVFAIDQFTLTATAGPNGAISPNGATVVNYGSNVSYTITPNTGYHIDSLVIDGANVGALGTYSFTNVIANHTVRAVFAINQFVINTTTGPNGSISPIGPTIVNYGANQSYTITPNTGYHVDSVIVDGASVGPVAAYTFTNVTANHTIRTVYAINQFTITATAGPNGTITPNGSVGANFGSNQTFTITPNTGYHIDSVIVDGANLGQLTSYTFTSISTNHTIRAVFAPNAITVTVQTTPAGLQINVDNVLYASPHSFSWIAAQPHSISILDTIAGGTGRRFVWSTWSDSGAKAHLVTPLVNSTLTAVFTTQFFLTMSANTGGTVTPPNGWRDSASVVTINAVPDARYHFNIWSGSGNGSYSFNANPATVTMSAPISETANFVRNPIQITVNTSPPGRTFGYNGTLFTTQQTFTINPGTTIFLNIFDLIQTDGTPGKQFVWTSWSDGGAASHSVTPDNDTTFTAFFTTQFYLTMVAKSGGSVAPPSNWQDSGHVVGITATPLTGFTFAGWTGAGNGSFSGPNNPATVTMNGPVRDTASFTQFPVNVTIHSSPEGRDIVVDGVHATAPQSYIWTSLSNHTIATVDSQEAAGTRYIYRFWSDGGAMTHVVAPGRDTSYTVFFRQQFYLAIGADSGGTVSPLSAYRDSGSVANISASPASGYSFSGWTGSGTGSYSGTNNPAVVTMGSPISEIAHFSRFNAQVTIQTVPAGLTIVVDSAVYSAPQVFTWATGSSHTVSTIAIQTASAGTRQVWSTWSDSGALSHVVIPSGASTITANFTTQYFLTINTNPGGTASPASNWFNSGQVVQIQGIPDSTHYFNLWTGVGAYAYSGGANPANVLMFGPATETANFIRRPVTIVIQANPPGRAFIYDGVTYTDPQTRNVLPGEQHFLNAASPQSATPGTQYVFANWSDGGPQTHSIFPDSDATYIVNFTKQYFLTIIAETGGTGTPASGWRDSGEIVSISAAPNFTYSFTGWHGAGNGSYSGPDNPAIVTMNGPVNDTAAFTQNPVHVTIQTNPPGRRFTVDGIDDSTSQPYVWIAGSTHSLAAADTELVGTTTRYIWQSWSDGGARNHNIAPTRDTIITVTFATQYYLTMNAGTGGTVAPQSGWRTDGASVNISALPNPTYSFGGWNGTGSISYTGTNNLSSVTMNSPITESASFVQTPVSIAFTTAPPGRLYIVDGIEYSKAEVFTWNSGSAHTVSVTTPQGSIEGVQYAWRSWSDGRAVSHTIFPTTDSAFTAAFTTQFMLTMMSDSGGSVTPANGWQDSGKIVQLTAIPAPEFQFNGWNGTGPGEYTGGNNPVAIRIDGPITQLAGFGRFDAQIIIATSPPSRKVIVDNVEYITPTSFFWTTGSVHAIAVADTQTGSAGTRFLWSSWSDAKPRSHTITVQKDSTFTATFSTQYFLATSANAGGTVDPPSRWFDAGRTVIITGVPDARFAFDHWNGSGNGSYDGFNNPATVTMNGPLNERANFRALPILFSISTNPAGRQYLYNGSLQTTAQTFSVLPGVAINLDAPSPQPVAAGTQYVWSSWSDSGSKSHSIIPVTDDTLTANFDLQYALTVNVTPALAGTTTPPGITFANDGDTVLVTAHPATGYAFSSWSGAVVSTDNPVAVIMNSPKTMTANFVLSATVTVATQPAGRSITVDGIDYVAPKVFSWIKGTPHTISTAATQPGSSGTQYAWSSWNDRGTRTHTVSPSSDTSFVATFITQHYLTVTSSAGGHVIPTNGWVNAGSSVVLRALPDSGYHFVEWFGTGSGSYSGTNDTTVITFNGPITENATFGVILPGPLLSGVPDKSTNISTSPLLSWMNYPGGTSYRLQVSADSTFAIAIFDSSGIADTACRVPLLANLIKYYWRVNARVPGNITSYSAVRSFTTINATIAVGSQGVNWGTGYTYPITWNSTDLSGTVNIFLKLNNGASTKLIEDSLSGNGTYHWKVPDSASYVSPTCKIRVTSALNPQIFAESNLFAIVAGALPATITVTAPTLAFPAEPFASSDYRLFSIPGIADTFKVGSFISGTQVKDWRMFSDNGADVDYLEELTSASPLTTGTGYWLVRKGNLQIPSFAMIVPPLSPDATYAIPVTPGWNIIANPFNYTIPWSSIVDASGLAPTSEISAFNGAYESSPVLEPFRGYYFFNDGSVQALKMQYPFGLALPSGGTAPQQDAGSGWKLQLAYSSGTNRDEDNYIGVSHGAKQGMDAMDSRKPPAFLDQDFLSLTRPDWDPHYPRFSKDLRPSIGEGQEWKFEISNPRKSGSVIEVRGLEDVPAGYKVVLINGDNSSPVDLRLHPSVAFQPARKVTAMRILVGSEQYVEREVSKLLPTEFNLAQNFPNPFNPTTSIGVNLPVESSIRLEIYSILGQRVKVLADGQFAAGTHTFVWAGTDEFGNILSSGIYVYRLTANGKAMASKKMIFAK